MPRTREITRTAHIGGVAKSSERFAQVEVVEGAPSHLKTGSSNPYEPSPCATAKAKSVNVHKHVTEMTVSLESGMESEGPGARNVMMRPRFSSNGWTNDRGLVDSTTHPAASNGARRGSDG